MDLFFLLSAFLICVSDYGTASPRKGPNWNRPLKAFLSQENPADLAFVPFGHCNWLLFASGLQRSALSDEIRGSLSALLQQLAHLAYGFSIVGHESTLERQLRGTVLSALASCGRQGEA